MKKKLPVELASLIIEKPRITEKGTQLTGDFNQYVFKVALYRNRTEIKYAVESLFNVKVSKVRTLVTHGKVKGMRQLKTKRSNWKKAYVTLEKGHKIELIQGV